MTTMVGILLLVLWIAYLFEGRKEMNRRERLSQAYIFQWNILPLIVALEILVTGNIITLAVGLFLFFVAWPFAKFCLATLPFATGWHLGVSWFSEISALQAIQTYTAAVLCAVLLTLFCQTVYVVMLSPPRHT